MEKGMHLHIKQQRRNQHWNQKTLWLMIVWLAFLNTQTTA